jgi:hypothetical protein
MSKNGDEEEASHNDLIWRCYSSTDLELRSEHLGLTSWLYMVVSCARSVPILKALPGAYPSRGRY